MQSLVLGRARRQLQGAENGLRRHIEASQEPLKPTERGSAASVRADDAAEIKRGKLGFYIYNLRNLVTWLALGGSESYRRDEFDRLDREGHDLPPPLVDEQGNLDTSRG